MSLLLFDPKTNGLILQRGYLERHIEQVAEDRSEIGSVKSVAVSNRPLRRWTLFYRAFTFAAREYVIAFWRHHVGAAGRFLFELPELIPAPFLAPTVEAPTGGAQAQRTITVRHTLLSTLGETTPSPQASIVVPANALLRVSLPAYPPGVTQVRIYAAQGAGTNVLQVTLNGERVWTQPDAALITGTAAVPTKNTAKERAKVKFVAESMEPVRFNGTHYEIGLQLEEVYA